MSEHDSLRKQGLCALLTFALLTIAQADAAFRETLTPGAPSRDLREGYGLISDDTINQSDKLQQAIDELSAAGGGRLLLPRGNYSFADVVFKSNVHLLIQEGAVLKPYIAEGDVRPVIMFRLGMENEEVENVSIRGCDGKRWTVQFRPHENGLRVIACKMVRNFLISNMNVNECRTKFCAIILAPPDTSPDKSGFCGPTDGTIRDCSVLDADGGYGLAQLHAGKRVLLESLYTEGGVAMRIETGVRPKNPNQVGGAFDVEGRNLKSKNAGTCVLLSPHSTHSGVVKVDGVEAISCDFAVKIGKGFISRTKTREGPTPGSFAPGTSVKNVKATFGTHSQRGWTSMKYCHPELLKHVRLLKEGDPRKLRGASIAPVLYTADYDVEIENVEGIGFEYVDKPIITEADAMDPQVVKTVYREHLQGIGWSNQWKKDEAEKKRLAAEHRKAKQKAREEREAKRKGNGG